MSNKISTREAFDAMRLFLEEFYNRTDSDDVGSLLGGIQFCDDNTTMDPAAWDDWLNCIMHETCVGGNLSYLEALKSMICFLENYYEQTSSDDVGDILGGLLILEDGRTTDPSAWDRWMDCVNKVMNRSQTKDIPRIINIAERVKEDLDGQG